MEKSRFGQGDGSTRGIGARWPAYYMEGEYLTVYVDTSYVANSQGKNNCRERDVGKER